MIAPADVAALCALALTVGVAAGALLVLPAFGRVSRERDAALDARNQARADAWRWRKLARGRMRAGADHSA